jgi:hypothetical protein
MAFPNRYTDREYTKVSLSDVDPRRGIHSVRDYFHEDTEGMQPIDQRYIVNEWADDPAYNKWLAQERRYFNLNRKANDAYLSRFELQSDLKGLWGGRSKMIDSDDRKARLKVMAVSDVPTMKEDYAVGLGITHANTFDAIYDPETDKYVRNGSDFGWYDEVSDLDRIVTTMHGNRKQRPFNYVDEEKVSMRGMGPNHAIMLDILDEIDDASVVSPMVLSADPAIRLSIGSTENTLAVEAGAMDRMYRQPGLLPDQKDDVSVTVTSIDADPLKGHMRMMKTPDASKIRMSSERRSVLRNYGIFFAIGIALIALLLCCCF